MTNTSTSHAVRPIGWVHSPLQRRADAPKQGHEGAPNARVQIEPAFLPGLDGIRAEQDILLLTWLHEAQRDVLAVHPRDDESSPFWPRLAARCHSLPPKSPSYPREVVITVPDGVILEEELAREWGIGVERYWGSVIELPVA